MQSVRFSRFAHLSAVAILFFFGAAPVIANPGISFVGKGSIPGTATDLSDLTGTYTGAAGTIPANRLGSFGSGLAYTGFGNTYLAVNDRGYGDGVSRYADRMQVFTITVNAQARIVMPKLKATVLLMDEAGQNFLGISSAFTGNDAAKNRRLDPEGVRVAPDGTFYVSDEYGPNLYHFNPQGRRIGVLRIPREFQVTTPDADGDTETGKNSKGRVANRGMEGLAISPDGSTLFGIMQSPLIQDGGRKGVNNRILQVNLKTGATRQYVYTLQNSKYGVNEILAVNDHQFLVDERDGKGGDKAAYKTISLIDLAGATDVSGKTLPVGSLSGSGIVTVQEKPFLNLLDPAYGLSGPDFPEKIEGLAFGPDFPNGDHLLLVTSDNDLLPANPSVFFAFRVPAAALPGYAPSRYRVPFTLRRTAK